MRNILAFIVFIPLQILFIPLAMIGAIWVGYKQLVVGVAKYLIIETWRYSSIYDNIHEATILQSGLEQ